VRWRLQRGIEDLRARLDKRFQGERGSWCVALLPLLRRPPLGEIAAGTLSAVAKGILVMNSGTKVGMAAVVVLTATLGVWIASERRVDKASAHAEPETLVQNLALQAPPGKTPAETFAPDSPEGSREVIATLPPKVEAVASGLSNFAQVEARFSDQTLRPLHDVRMKLVAGHSESTATSAADGRVVIKVELPEVHWDSTFEAACSEHATMFASVGLDRGRTTLLGDLTLEPGGAVEGRVLGPDGRPLAGADVIVTKPDFSGEADMIHRTGPSTGPVPRSTSTADGAFRVEGVPAQAVRVWAGAEGMRYSFTAPINVSPGETLSGVVLSLEPLAQDDHIEGIVLEPDGSPVPSAKLRYSFEATNRSGTSVMRSGADGRFRIRLQAKVPHNIQVEDPKNRWPSVSALAVVPGTLDLRLRFAEPRWLTLRVRSSDGAPIQGFLAYAISVDNTRIFDKPSGPDHSDGTDRLAIPTEPFRIRLYARGYAREVLGPWTPKEAPSENDCVLESAPGIRGRVLAGGQPLPKARVQLHRLSSGERIEAGGFLSRMQPHAEDSVETDSEGCFQVGADPEGGPLRGARFAILCDAEGYATSELSPVEADPAVGVCGLEIRLSVGGAIEGRVLLPDRRDPTGVIVAVDRGDARPRTQRVGPDGAFRFERLTPGSWLVKRVQAEIHPGHGTTAFESREKEVEYPSNCTVEDGRTTRFDLDLSAGLVCVLNGRVRVNGKPALGWTVTVRPDGDTTASDIPATAVDARGEMRIEVESPGRYRVILCPPADSGSGGQIWIPVDLQRGENLWPLDLAAGALKGRKLAPLGEQSLGYKWEGPAGAIFQTLFVVDALGRFEMPIVPAGRGEIRRFVRGQSGDWHAESEKWVDIPAGGTEEVELP
jgi:hypothetical protein